MVINHLLNGMILQVSSQNHHGLPQGFGFFWPHSGLCLRQLPVLQRAIAQRSTQPEASWKARGMDLKFTPQKTTMTMENPPFEDAFPIENWDFPMSC